MFIRYKKHFIIVRRDGQFSAYWRSIRPAGVYLTEQRARDQLDELDMKQRRPSLHTRCG